MVQPNNDPETGEERDTDEFTTSRSYNLQPMPTKKPKIHHATNGPTANHTKTTCPYHDDTNECKKGIKLRNLVTSAMMCDSENQSNYTNNKPFCKEKCTHVR